MQYKTTYFKISLNEEITQSYQVFNYRLNPDKLDNDIKQEEIRLDEYIKKYHANEPSVIGVDINKLKERIGEKKNNDSSRTAYDKLIKLNKIKEDIKNQRFTNKHEVELTNHLNDTASDGWELHSMNPIIKGLFNYNDYEKKSYGYAHEVIEGFVLVWKKE